MTDLFAVLQLERRPWIDSDQLKQVYQERAFAAHPDRDKTAEAGGSDFGTVTEAYRVLSNPRLRLQHLLALQDKRHPTNEPVPVPGVLSELFMTAAQLVGEIDSFLQKRDQTTSTLGKSLLQSEAAEIRRRTGALLSDLEKHYREALNDLKTIDAKWAENCAEAVEEIKALVQRFAFLDRWLDQLRERQFELSS